jgi:fused signal recognition particle receptor
MTTPKRNILEEIKTGEKPYIIMMLGPNGAGKTTHIAKLTHYFKKQGLSCVWAAADTFRSGAIHQLQEHADKLDIKVIKQQYGADPAAVAFDALTSAQANKFDIILIDTAGRQETNKNLMEELKKIERVVKPNLKIYVGESYTGQGLLTMAQEFDKAIGIDGFILSKIDADAKGGTTISLLYQLKKPIFYVGTGQGYEDLQEFSPEFILNRII